MLVRKNGSFQWPGGTGNIFGPQYEQHRLELKKLSDYVALYGQRPPEFEPGSKHVYSNYGFVLLGVVERVSGQSYYDYVRQHIFMPAGMRRTDSKARALRWMGARSDTCARAAGGRQIRTHCRTVEVRPGAVTRPSRIYSRSQTHL